MKESLNSIRQELDDVDARLVENLAQRFEIIRRTAELKAGSDTALKDSIREEEILTRCREEAEARGLQPSLVSELFRTILEFSVRCQTDRLSENGNGESGANTLKVGYQGGTGAYSQLAAKRHFAERQGEIQCVGYNTFRDVVEAVERKDVDQAILPIENTTAGSINDVYDLLAQASLSIVGEEVLRIEHCLLATSPMPVDQVRLIRSHPQALAQCSAFLASLSHCVVEAHLDTALAAAQLRESTDRHQAAIGSEEAARLYDLFIIARDLANTDFNLTRFVVVSPQPVDVDLRVPCKTSLVFTTPHRQGALAECLTLLAAHGLNLTKLESRPIPNAPWDYRFYADIEANLRDPNTASALEEVTALTTYLRILGSYPARVT